MESVIEWCGKVMAQKDVRGLVVIDKLGRAIHSTFEEEQTTQYSQLVHKIIDNSLGAAREFDQSDDLKLVRVRTGKYEVYIAPENNYIVATFKNL